MKYKFKEIESIDDLIFFKTKLRKKSNLNSGIFYPIWKCEDKIEVIQYGNAGFEVMGLDYFVTFNKLKELFIIQQEEINNA